MEESYEKTQVNRSQKKYVNFYFILSRFPETEEL